ncbi:hypothetical protein EMCG_07671 [[Emmonsia] crescens]|uniref:Uncharacterized protein n=1 Tax=[Emmonsia] crescens TaxID=73230 RepID=A0A0G2I7F2_9EURO|nr:hypothetical protein EMCG_07671 [Emmonsia crescens UAMH 3008]
MTQQQRGLRRCSIPFNTDSPTSTSQTATESAQGLMGNFGAKDADGVWKESILVSLTSQV